MTLRVYLAGEIHLEAGERVLAEADLGGRQARLALAYLVCANGRPVPKAELAELVWPDELPDSWEISLAAVVSKLRSLFARLDVSRQVIDGALGCYQLKLPAGSWVDVLEVPNHRYKAEGALRRGEPSAAGPDAMIASTIARRPFLAEERASWVEGKRAELREELARSLEIFAATLLHDRDHGRATEIAGELLELEPYRETGYQLLMRAQHGAGNRAEALRTYDRCRRLLRDELGVDPSPATEAVYLEILRE